MGALPPPGPVCARCGGTVWTYKYGDPTCPAALGIAECDGCNLIEGPLRLGPRGIVRPMPETPAEARQLHERFRESLPGGAP